VIPTLDAERATVQAPGPDLHPGSAGPVRAGAVLVVGCPSYGRGKWTEAHAAGTLAHLAQKKALIDALAKPTVGVAGAPP